MCGIAGTVNLNKTSASQKILQKMTDAISHRGPDGEGHWIENNVALGHRRLSVIDISTAGNQPMISNDKNYVISYNGEIYNFKELRSQLQTHGYRFNSNSDTEVVLYALIHWGVDALLKFNGMFALALWNKKDDQLLLARDRYGVKPLYYTSENNCFLFASEQKAIIAHPEFTKELNEEALAEYFTFQNIFTNQTLIKNINLLPSGHYGLLSTKNNRFEITSFWDYEFNEPNYNLSKHEYSEELERLFFQSVNRQLVSDVELGTYLSGGMDSGSITSIAAQNFPYLKSFTCGFDLSSASGIEISFDERTKAEHMSYLFKTEHYEMVLKAGDMERCLPKLAWHLEEPRVGQSYPNFYAAQLASKFVKVVLSGAGGDELFGGYPWRYYRAISSQSFDDFVGKYYHYWQRLLTKEELKQVFSPIINQIKHVSTLDIFKEVFPDKKPEISRPEDYVNHSLYFEAKTFLHSLFIVEDKISMSHSLETRVPFMDNDLVNFAMKCPVSLKLNNLSKVIRIDENSPGKKTSSYFKKTNDGKQILRDMMVAYIPKSITSSQKQGFSSPDASWFKGESIDFVRNTLLNKNALIYNFFDRKSVLNLVNQHLEGKKNRRLLIWSFLNIEEYFKQYL